MPTAKESASTEDTDHAETSLEPAVAAGILDLATFDQILEMDDGPDDREFSRSIVFDFFDQAENTFEQMDQALEDEDLEKLSALGHFLKGSSATLGLTLVKDSCEKIQHLGNRKDETGNEDEPDKQKSLRKLQEIIKMTKADFAEAEKALKKFYPAE